MKRSAMPLPITRRIHSSKFVGFPWATALATFASATPDRHLTCVMHRAHDTRELH